MGLWRREIRCRRFWEIPAIDRLETETFVTRPGEKFLTSATDADDHFVRLARGHTLCISEILASKSLGDRATRGHNRVVFTRFKTQAGTTLNGGYQLLLLSYSYRSGFFFSHAHVRWLTNKTQPPSAAAAILHETQPTYLFNKFFHVSRLHKLFHQRGQYAPTVHLKSCCTHWDRRTPFATRRHARRSPTTRSRSPHCRPPVPVPVPAPPKVRRRNRRQQQELGQGRLAVVAHTNDLLVGGRPALVPLVHPDIDKADESPQVDGPAQIVGRVALAPDRPVFLCLFGESN